MDLYIEIIKIGDSDYLVIIIYVKLVELSLV